MNDITQFTDISKFLTMAFAGMLMINMLCMCIALILRFSKVLRISAASIIASLTTSWISWVFLSSFLPTKMMNAGWMAGLFFLSLLLVYVGWLYIFQPKSLEKMLKSELYHKQSLRIDQQIAECKNKLKILDKNSSDFNKMNNEIASLKNEKAIAKKDLRSFPFKLLGKRLCKSSK